MALQETELAGRGRRDRAFLRTHHQRLRAVPPDRGGRPSDRPEEMARHCTRLGGLLCECARNAPACAHRRPRRGGYLWEIAEGTAACAEHASATPSNSFMWACAPTARRRRSIDRVRIAGATAQPMAGGPSGAYNGVMPP